MSLTLHPELRHRIREIFRIEGNCARRAEELTLAVESAWLILGYSTKPEPPTERQVLALASIAAGLLRAEEDVGGRPALPPDAVRLRLIQGGLSVVGSGDGHQAPEGPHS